MQRGTSFLRQGHSLPGTVREMVSPGRRGHEGLFTLARAVMLTLTGPFGSTGPREVSWDPLLAASQLSLSASFVLPTGVDPKKTPAREISPLSRLPGTPDEMVSHF